MALIGQLIAWADSEKTEDVLTVTEAARRLKVSRDNVLGWIHTGRLRAANTAKGTGRPRYRIARTDLDAFLSCRTRQPAVKERRRPIPASAKKYFPES